MTCGDNINSVHKLRTIDPYPDRELVYCERCRRKYSIHPKDPSYMKLCKRDTLQPGTNLYYKEFPNKMNIA